MEQSIFAPAPSVAPSNDTAQDRAGVSWRDLREWIALIERNGELQRIGKEVSADEDLAAIVYMATRQEKAPALLFENIAGDRSGSRVSPTCWDRARSAMRWRSGSTRISRSPR